MKILIKKLKELPLWHDRMWVKADDLNAIIAEYEHDQSFESHNRELLAVIAAKDDLLRKVSVADYSGNYRYREDAKEILAIKPGDIALIEIGAVDHSSMIELMPGSASMVNFRDKVYVIQTKSNTEYRMI